MSSSVQSHPKKLLAAVLTAVFTVMLGVGIIAPLLPMYAKSLGANGILLGAIFAVFSASRTFWTPLAGALSDRFGRKGFMLCGLIVYCIVSIAYIKANTLAGLILVRALHGFAAALVVPAANAYVGDVAPPESEGLYSGIFLVSFFSGFAMGPAFGGVLYDRFGMAGCFLTLGFLSLLAFLLTALFIPNLRVSRPSGSKKMELLKPLRYPHVVPLLAFTLVSALGRSSIVCFLPLFAQEKLGISASLLGAVLTTNLLLAAILQLPSGMLADRFNRKAMLLTGTVISGLMFAFIPSATGFLSLLAVNILMGLGMALTFPSTQAVAVTLGRDLGMGAMLSFLQVATGLGFAVGPLLSGVIYKSLGIHAVFYVCSGILSAAAAYGILFLELPSPSSPEVRGNS